MSSTSEADAESVLRIVTPSLDPKRHKGQAGKIAVIGGCREYTRAPYFAAISALKIECISNIMVLAKKANVPFVVDGDGLFLVTNSIDLVKSYPLAVLTPNVNEYKRLVQKVLNFEVDEQNAEDQLCSLAKHRLCHSGLIGGVTILKKGKSDLISNGETVKSVSINGSPRRCGGQGDILSGSPFENPAILGCIAASGLLRKAASLAFTKQERSTLTSRHCRMFRGEFGGSALHLNLQNSSTRVVLPSTAYYYCL